MRHSFEARAGWAALACLALIVGACSSSASSTATTASTSATAAPGGTATVLMGTAPDSLDPQFGYTTQSAEATWISYTPLLTYAHKSGQAGSELIPGLAAALPTISADGLTYSLQLRPNLVYSNGAPVKASDFGFTIERAIKLNWGGKSFFTNYIKGSSDYDTGKATSISGIVADDASGKITITLTQQYGAFANVLAFPAAGLVPAGSPMTNQPTSPPPGAGPYTITNVVPNQSFTLQKNPKFNVAGIPSGYLDTINVKIVSNTVSEGQQVLSNQADSFDAGDTIPPTLLSQIQSTAGSRFAAEPVPSTFYFFLNTTEAPFDNPLARQAVNYAVDRRALQRLASGFLNPECYFLPAGMPGHPSNPCPYGDPNAAPDTAKAKALVQQAGLVGAPVTVWGETRSPRQQYIQYYTSVLNDIGFKATPKIIQDSLYFPTIGNASTNPQTGFADWSQDFPNPSDFYLLLDARSIQPTNNQNFSKVNDPHVQSELLKLNAVPATQLSSVAAEWQALDEYVAKQAYVVVYGTEEDPKFLSDRIDFGSAVFHPLFLNDWSSWRLTK